MLLLSLSKSYADPMLVPKFTGAAADDADDAAADAITNLLRLLQLLL